MRNFGTKIVLIAGAAVLAVVMSVFGLDDGVLDTATQDFTTQEFTVGPQANVSPADGSLRTKSTN
mgnify:CR=1 FL=1